MDITCKPCRQAQDEKRQRARPVRHHPEVRLVVKTSHTIRSQTVQVGRQVGRKVRQTLVFAILFAKTFPRVKKIKCQSLFWIFWGKQLIPSSSVFGVAKLEKNYSKKFFFLLLLLLHFLYIFGSVLHNAISLDIFSKHRRLFVYC